MHSSRLSWLQMVPNRSRVCLQSQSRERWWSESSNHPTSDWCSTQFRVFHNQNFREEGTHGFASCVRCVMISKFNLRGLVIEIIPAARCATNYFTKSSINDPAVIAASTAETNWQEVLFTMDGDSFQFSIGPPNSGFSMFMADRTKKVHFIRLNTGLWSLVCKVMWRTIQCSDEDSLYSNLVMISDMLRVSTTKPPVRLDRMTVSAIWSCGMQGLPRCRIHSGYLSNLHFLNLLMLEIWYRNRTELSNASNLDAS